MYVNVPAGLYSLMSTGFDSNSLNPRQLPNVKQKRRPASEISNSPSRNLSSNTESSKHFVAYLLTYRAMVSMSGTSLMWTMGLLPVMANHFLLSTSWGKNPPSVIGCRWGCHSLVLAFNVTSRNAQPPVTFRLHHSSARSVRKERYSRSICLVNGVRSDARVRVMNRR